jgi:DNA modification methylase
VIEVHAGDCREIMPRLAAAGILFDSAVIDPPYHLTSIVERFGAVDAAPAQSKETGVYARSSRGFMGQEWDGGDVAFRPETWRLVYDLLKPGAHLCAFAATRNYHRMAVAIEDAGFEIRDMIGWLYGTGFPKSHPIGKAIDRLNGDERPVLGSEWLSNDIRAGGLLDAEHGVRPGFERKITGPASDQSREWEGWGTAIRPSQEPICLARKPLSEKSVAANVLKWRTGALNIAGCRLPYEDEDDLAQTKAKNPGRDDTVTSGVYGANRPQQMVDETGRWPANIILDDSDEVAALFPPAAKRFFYTTKATKWDRLATSHPTVKPVDLLRWVTRLVTPPGGRVLDCFAGTGTTGAAAMLEGFDADLVELNPAYLADIERRFAFMRGAGRHSTMETVNFDDPAIAEKAAGTDLPLFK